MEYSNTCRESNTNPMKATAAFKEAMAPLTGYNFPQSGKLRLYSSYLTRRMELSRNLEHNINSMRGVNPASLSPYTNLYFSTPGLVYIAATTYTPLTVLPTKMAGT